MSAFSFLRKHKDNPAFQLPMMAFCFSSETSLFPNIIPVCADGSPTNDPVNPCSDHPPAVRKFSVTAWKVRVQGV